MINEILSFLGSESVEILDTPTSELLSSDSAISEDSKDSPESVEIISEDIVQEDEEDSFSYNTISESTAATVLEPFIHPPITTPPSRSTLHLSLGTSISSSFEKDRNMAIEISSKTTSECDTEDSAESERTVMSDTGKNISLLEDAMLEKSFTHLSDSTQSFEDVHSNLLESYPSDNPRESISPNSDEKSDLVKISSEQTSGHTSADETATSSDIEIISSPNGDSSSTNSAYRPSPLAIVSQKSAHFEQTVIKKKGHCREDSEVSMHSDDSNFSSHTEAEKLLKRISELSELLEVREFKLVEMGRQNAELLDRNFEFKSQLEAKLKGGLQTNLDLTNVTEEYTQRLSALEKRFQQTIRERDQLRQQLDLAKSDSSSMISKEEVGNIIKENEYITAELRTEGEKLSKQVLQHSNIIKKLRAKEKENDATLKKQKEQIEEFTDETERLKKSLSAKDEMERSQIEAVHKFSSEKRKLDKENSQLKSQMEDITQKLMTIQTSFERAKKELNDKKQAHMELYKRSEAFASMESENILNKNHNEQIIIQLESLREKLKQAESGNELKERKLRVENSELLKRLENAELRVEEQANDVSLVTIPLVKELESLQTTLNSRTTAWEKQKKNLVDRLQETQEKLSNFNEIEKNLKEQNFLLNSKILNFEDHLNSALFKSEQSSNLLQQKEMECDLLQMDFKRENENIKIIKLENEKILEDYKNRLINLEERLKNESEKLEIEKLKFTSESRNLTSDESNTLEENPNNRNSSSPTLSLGRMSIADSLGSSAWHFDDLDCISNSGRPSGGSVYGGFIPIGASLLENLQSTLKQRDGELYQLQWELSRLQAERSILTTEVSNLTMELENVGFFIIIFIYKMFKHYFRSKSNWK